MDQDLISAIFKEYDVKIYQHLVDTGIFKGTLAEYIEQSKNGCLGPTGVVG